MSQRHSSRIRSGRDGPRSTTVSPRLVFSSDWTAASGNMRRNWCERIPGMLPSTSIDCTMPASRVGHGRCRVPTGHPRNRSTPPDFADGHRWQLAEEIIRSWWNADDYSYYGDHSSAGCTRHLEEVGSRDFRSSTVVTYSLASTPYGWKLSHNINGECIWTEYMSFSPAGTNVHGVSFRARAEGMPGKQPQSVQNTLLRKAS